MFKTQHILWSTHMANFNILILPSNQSSENILFLVYRWCCNRKREQLPVGGELLQATCSLKYQLLEWLISSIHHGFTHFQISSMSFYRYDEFCCILRDKNGLKVITVDTDNFLKLHVYCNFTSMTHRMTCFVMVHTVWKIMKLTE